MQDPITQLSLVLLNCGASVRLVMERAFPNTLKNRILEVHLEGPAVKGHRISVDDFGRLIHNIQLATKRLGQRIAGQEGKRTGRLVKDVEAACRLEIIAVHAGSVSVQLGLPPPAAQPSIFGDTGGLALERLLDGLEMLDRSDNEWPTDFDPAVVDPVLELGRILNHGVEKIEFKYGLREGKRRKTTYTPRLRDRIEKRIAAPVRQQVTLIGFLLEIDFKDRTAEIHQTLGQVIKTSFPETLDEIVLAAAKRQVKIIGTGDKDETGRIGKVEAIHLEICEGPKKVQLVEQIALASSDDPFAGRAPVQNLSTFFKNFPDNRSAEEMIRDLRANRSPREID